MTRVLIQLCTLLALTLGAQLDAVAQSIARTPRIGVLFIGHASPADTAASGLVSGLRELGHDVGRTIVLDIRYAQGRPERLAALARELVESKVDVIVAGGPGPLEAARRATDTIPIVTVAGSDPVGEGWARSLARPGGNVTGLTVTFPDLASKRIELLKQALPQLTRLGVLLDPEEILLSSTSRDLQSAAQTMGIQLQLLQVREPADFERAFRLAREGRAQAILGLETTFVVLNRGLIAEFAAREKMPLVGEFAAFGSEGMLMIYGADLSDQLRRCATYVDRILKGAHPGDLPIERPTKIELLLNLKAARALGITFPQALLLRADRVVD